MVDKKDPTATGIDDGKDGATPTENQGTIDELGGPGVDPDVSLSPDEDGVPTGLDVDDDPVDKTPVITKPEDATTIEGLEPTFVTQSTLQTQISGATPTFSGTKFGGVLSIRKVGWIGPDTFDLHEEDVEELVSLVRALKKA